VGELAELARRHHLPLIADVGSGAIVPLHEYGISDEPLVKDCLTAGGGADIACFSGDKLISGPQAGIICGKKAWIEKIRKSPYARMFRVCKMTLAGLEATLLHFLNGTYRTEIPFYWMMGRKVAELEMEARALAEGLRSVPGVTVEVADDLAYVGSGSVPDEGIPSKVVRVTHGDVAAGELVRRLRLGIPSVFGRLQDRTLVLDMRTVLAGEREELIGAVRLALAGSGAGGR